MQSFVDFDLTLGRQPPRLGALLARIDVGCGREDLFADQLPQLLASLAEETRIASITASSALEGVVVAPERAERIGSALGAGRFRNRNEREFAGYRDAIDGIVRADRQEELSVPLILHLHRLLYAHGGGRGGYLKTEENLIVSYVEGRRAVLFTPVLPAETEFALTELVARYNAAVGAEAAHPVVLVGALILDFLAIHPFANGNGRIARILTTQQLLARGYGVPRYVSVEQRIFESKNAYYDALCGSQREWHEGTHSVWPWIEYLAGVLADAYALFEQRVAAGAGTRRLSKQQRVRVWVLDQAPARFRFREIRRAVPGVSDATIKLVLGELRNAGLIEAERGGSQSEWRRL